MFILLHLIIYFFLTYLAINDNYVGSVALPGMISLDSLRVGSVTLEGSVIGQFNI